LERNEVEVRYQPIYDLRTMKPTGVEALARWTHPELGDISPSRFIPLAEETGLIDAVLDQVMRRACLEMREVYSHAPNGSQLKLSVNLSCRQFAGADLLSRICNILEETGYAASQLKLEITESVLIEYQERAIEMLHKIREMGIELDIDDFGTGYSNLSYLVRLPISTLKIDRSFVCPINDDGANIEIVRTILALARNLGLTVVAEGIETEEQVKSLIDLDCERGQGFLLSKPLTAAGLKELLERDDETPMPPMHYDDVSTLSTLQ
nr:EAL domain-containing protein [Blastocatellia bacterium]